MHIHPVYCESDEKTDRETLFPSDFVQYRSMQMFSRPDIYLSQLVKV